jgi:hypothetical protein
VCSSPVGVLRYLCTGFFLSMIRPVAVEGDKEDLLMHLAPTGSSTGCSSKSFFLLHATAHSSGTTRQGWGTVPTVGRSETGTRVAKAAP